MSHPQNDIWLETMKEWRDEMREPMECGACGEVSLQYVETTNDAPFIETWECDCGHIRCFHVSAKLASVTRGFGKNISHAYHCTACGSEIDISELEQEKQNWWAQQDQDDEWIEENG